MLALALYPARTKTSAGIFTAAFTSNMMTPLSSVALGETYSRVASSSTFCRAPIVSFTGMPSCSLPTSVSSTLPRKSMFDMSATEAMVVPSLNVLAWITEFPTLIGTSRIIPSIVDRICVLLSSL